MPVELFEPWRIIYIRRMRWGNLELFSSHGFPLGLYGRLLFLWEAASRKIGRARRCWLRSQVSPDTEEMRPIPPSDGTVR